jgi:hypothetical protein
MENRRQRIEREKYFNLARNNWGHERRFHEQRREVMMKKETKTKEK